MRRRDPDKLTDREREVLDLLRRDFTNEQIAQRLGISLDGAKYHVSQILSKLGVSSRDEAAAVALGERRRWWTAFPMWAKIAGAATVAMGITGSAVFLATGMIGGGSEEVNFDQDRTEFLSGSRDSFVSSAEIGEVPPITLDEVHRHMDQGEIFVVLVIKHCSPEVDSWHYSYRGPGRTSSWQILDPHVRVWIEGSDEGYPVLSEEGTSIGVAETALANLLDRAVQSGIRVYDDRQDPPSFCSFSPTP